MPSFETQRGVLQLISGLCWALFAMGMFVRAWRRYRIGWPVAWGMLAGSAMLAAAYTLGVHGLYWLGALDAGFDGWPLLVPLYVLAVASLWTLFRWIRSGEPDELTTIPGDES